jgi:hypothetical protein
VSKHTPGPWHWEYSDATFARPIALSAGDKGDVMVASEDADGPRAYVTPANEALIAASPDLLAACKEFVAWDVMEHPRQDDPALLEKISRKIRAAVEKAEGGEA